MSSDLPSLRAALLADPGRPRCTWYGPDGERVELSGKVLDNWVAKTANLLVDELDAGPGTRIAVMLPTHWRTLVWLLATWSAGAHAVIPLAAGETDDVDILVTTQAPALRAAGPILVAVTLPALATRHPGPLPAGAVDAATEVRLQPDAFLPPSTPSPTDPAYTVGASALSYGDLFASAHGEATAAGLREGDRVLTGAPPEHAVGGWLGPLVLGGSLVLHHDASGLDPQARASLETQEAVTARL